MKQTPKKKEELAWWFHAYRGTAVNFIFFFSGNSQDPHLEDVDLWFHVSFVSRG